MTKIVVLGAGVMGSAITMPLADNGHTVSLVGTHLDTDIIEALHETRVHPGLKIQLADRVTPYPIGALSEQLRDADLVILGVNSHGVDWAAETLGPVLPPEVPVLMVTKGLHGGHHGGPIDGERQPQLSILPDALRNGFPAQMRSRLSINAIGGPSIAGELAARRHTCVNIAGHDATLLHGLAGLLRTSYYHVWTSTDLIGVEVCVAMKNLYALAVGLVIGLLEKESRQSPEVPAIAAPAPQGTYMHNLTAALFAQGLAETAYLVEQLGGTLKTVYTLPGAGDLYVTCQGGRNSRMGRLLGLGMPYAEAMAKYMPGASVEGAMLALAVGPTVEAMVRKGRLDAKRIPLFRTMINIVCHNAPAHIPWDRFFAE